MYTLGGVGAWSAWFMCAWNSGGPAKAAIRPAVAIAATSTNVWASRSRVPMRHVGTFIALVPEPVLRQIDTRLRGRCRRSGKKRVVAEFATQVGDVNVDDVLVSAPSGTPYGVDDVAPTVDPPRAGSNGGEDVELGASQ